MKKILFLDFEDSFTYNVVQELEKLDAIVEIIHWSEFQNNSNYDLLVLGPGPGHPSDYSQIFQSIREWLNQGKKLLGICLGHQIFWELNGLVVEKSNLPIHGQAIELKLNDRWCEWFYLAPKYEALYVQRYNSLAVKGNSEIAENFIQDGEVLISQNKQVITYQFHPESIGTTCPSIFFSAVRRYLL